MVENVELASFDLRYETYRIRNKRDETRLFESIAQRGIEKPLEGVDTAQGRFLLNGFKRYRCAKKLMVDCVPYVSMGKDEVLGIVDLLRSSNDRSLVILEQARFIDDLLSTHHMSLAEVAQRLSRSKSWVSMRQGLMREMTEAVQQRLLAGAFPVYSYMATLRPFMRMNKVSKEEIDQFVHQRQEFECAGDRPFGARIFSGTLFASRSNRTRQGRLCPGPDEPGSRRPRRLHRIRANHAE